MLNNLKAELVRKGFDPVQSIVSALSCTEKTARSKLNNVTPVTVAEAVTVIDTYFQNGEFTIEYLFEDFKQVS